MIIKFWGTRGSCPGIGKNQSKYGGNTPCISIENNTDHIIIIDAGTGIRHLGNKLFKIDKKISIIITHVHWDHIQGFPFFAPIYEKDRTINLFSPKGEELLNYLLKQIDGIRFPMNKNDIPANLEFKTDLDYLEKDINMKISYMRANHPGFCVGYKFENNNKTVVIFCDNQLHNGPDYYTPFEEFVEFSKDTDLLVHDSQYLCSDLPHKKAWGHSLRVDVQELAKQANVKEIILFHNDPDRMDYEIDKIVALAQNWLKKQDLNIPCQGAYDGLEIAL